MLLDQNRIYLISDILCINNPSCVVKIMTAYFSSSVHSATWSPEKCALQGLLLMGKNPHVILLLFSVGGEWDRGKAMGLTWLMGSWLETQPLL